MKNAGSGIEGGIRAGLEFLGLSDTEQAIVKVIVAAGGLVIRARATYIADGITLANQAKSAEASRESRGALSVKVSTFHVEQDHMPSVIEALNHSLEELDHSPGYKGLLCLEHDGIRNQMIIITLWETADGVATADGAEDALALISDATDTGVTSRTYEVLALIPCPDGIPSVALAAN